VNAHLNRAYQVAMPYLRANRVMAVLAVAAVVLSIGLWMWSVRTKTHTLRLGAGVELKYRKELVGILCEEAAEYDLKIEVVSSTRSSESITKVAGGELDIAVVPAGMAVQDDNVRQVAVFDCEPLQLFVRPEVAALGIAGLKGRRVNMGSTGSGARMLAGEVVKFMGLTPGDDFVDECFTYQELIAMPPSFLPDGVVSLCPLPSPLGEYLVQKCGYRLMDLPYGAALGLRKSPIEDTTIPAHTYGANPAVPDHPLHTVGTRALLIANTKVPPMAIRHLLETLFESDFARRSGMPPLNESLVLRSAEYPNHAGTIAYLHRHDPWISKDFIDNFSSLRVFFVSIASAALLVWQWWRRSTTAGLSDYMLACTQIELEARQAAADGQFTATHCEGCLERLTEVRCDALEKHQAGVVPGDQQFALLLSRMDDLQTTLPRLLDTAAKATTAESTAKSAESPAPYRKAS